MEELYITVTIGAKGAIDHYRKSAEILQTAYDALDKATEALHRDDFGDGDAVKEAVDAIVQAKRAKAMWATVLADEVLFAVERRNDDKDELGVRRPKTCAERAREAREAVEAIKAREKDNPRIRRWYHVGLRKDEERDPDSGSDVKLKA